MRGVGASLALVVSGCVSGTVADHRRELLESYPPTVTTREDVHRGMAPIQPFENCPHRGADVERYRVPTGLVSLAVYSFYFDHSDRLVDVEWQTSTD